jgi:hypothetical protein
MLMSIEQFQETLVYRTTASVRRLRKDLTQIAEFERFHEAETKKGQRIGLIGASLVFISFFGCLFFWIHWIQLSSDKSSDNYIIGIIAYLIALILGIRISSWGNRLYNQHALLNTSPRRYRYELLQSLLSVWQKDLTPYRKLKLSLNLQKEDDQSKFQKQEPYLNRKDGKIDFYRDEWLKVKGLFLDETKFFLQVTELYQVRSWRNTNNKHRVRTVPKSLKITLKLNFLPERYPNLSDLKNRAKSAIKLPATGELKGLEIADNKLTIKLKIPSSPNTDALKSLLFQSSVMMFLNAYQILNLTRAMNQQKGV